MVQMAQLRYTKLDPQIPDLAYATSGDAGIDLVTTETVDFYPEGKSIVYDGKRKSYHTGPVLVGTGIAVEIPEGCFGMLVGRSSLGTKKNIRLANSVGVIDSGYRGEIKLALYYGAMALNDIVTIERYDRVAQLVVMPFVQAQPELVQDLSDSQRGTGGFGSTGT